MIMEAFEHRYQWYLDLLRDERSLGIDDLQVVERQLRRLDLDLAHADLTPGRRLRLLKARNEAMAEVTAALHHARIDDARAVQQAVAAGVATDGRLNQLRIHPLRR